MTINKSIDQYNHGLILHERDLVMYNQPLDISISPGKMKKKLSHCDIIKDHE